MEHKLLQIAVGVVIGLAKKRIVAPPPRYWQGRLARAVQGRALTR
jgi:hypothetical protein